METAIFAIFALLAVVSGVVVVAHKNPVHATLSLVLTLFSLAVLFVLLGAPFVATLQILIYAGAILVLFLFVIMLLNAGREENPPEAQRIQRWAALLGAAAFAGLLATIAWRVYGGAPPGPIPESLVSLRELARQLFDTYLLPFEMVGLLLLVAVVAATVVARRLSAPAGLDARDNAGNAADAAGGPP